MTAPLDPKAMRERPILFSAPMVRAILQGRKSQTRRIVKALRGEGCPEEMWPSPALTDIAEWHEQHGSFYGLMGYRTLAVARCPYGAATDALWVREGWRTESDCYNDLSPAALSGEETVLYDADADWSDNKSVGRRRASIHMPRWASRITLRVTCVRIERLQDISEADAEAEGVNRIKSKVPTHIDAYRYLWDEINGAGSWDANPWTWVVSFERMP